MVSPSRMPTHLSTRVGAELTSCGSHIRSFDPALHVVLILLTLGPKIPTASEILASPWHVRHFKQGRRLLDSRVPRSAFANATHISPRLECKLSNSFATQKAPDDRHFASTNEIGPV